MNRILRITTLGTDSVSSSRCKSCVLRNFHLSKKIKSFLDRIFKLQIIELDKNRNYMSNVR